MATLRISLASAAGMAAAATVPASNPIRSSSAQLGPSRPSSHALPSRRPSAPLASPPPPSPLPARRRSPIAAAADAGDENEGLKDAAKAGDVETVDRMLQSSPGVSVDLPSARRAGWTALHLAAFYGHPAVVRRLIAAGAGLEVRNQSGNTALHLASLKANIQVAQILLESGSDIHAESGDGGTALDYAQEWGDEDIVDFLLLWVARTRAKHETV